ncbi:hypothetical protein, partial [Comamonas thiooxydans]|uniref:hypothetical protein n=1 Tax=Comamonas thiooxydans TaxID=363952 RepID=UPI001C0EA193
HREFEQAIGIDVGQKSGHGISPIANTGQSKTPRSRRWAAGALVQDIQLSMSRNMVLRMELISKT